MDPPRGQSTKGKGGFFRVAPAGHQQAGLPWLAGSPRKATKEKGQLVMSPLGTQKDSWWREAGEGWSKAE